MSAARGIIHAHSSYSYDSTTPLADVAALARERGLAFVVQTEHSNEMTEQSYGDYVAEAKRLSGDDFVVVAGVEYASDDNAIHVLVVGVDAFWPDLARFERARMGELLDRVRASGGLSVLAHPERAHAIDKLPAGALERLDGIEVWNAKTDILGPSPRALAAVRSLAASGRAPFATAGLDLHRVEDFLPVGLAVKERPRTERDVLTLLAEKRYRIFVGPLAWNPHRAGGLAYAAAIGSRWAVRRARFVKAKLRAALSGATVRRP